MPLRDRKSPGRRRKICLRSKCTELVSHLHHTLPNWLPQTFCLEREHTSQKSCLVKAYPFSATFGGFLRNLSVRAVGLFSSPHFSQTVVCSVLLGRMLWQKQFCWPGVCSMYKWDSQCLFQSQCCGVSQNQIQDLIVKAGRDEEILQSLDPAPLAEWPKRHL